MRTLNDVPEDTRIQFAQMINEQDLPWKANAYTQVDMERLETTNMGMPFNFAQVSPASTKVFGQGAEFDKVLKEA